MTATLAMLAGVTVWKVLAWVWVSVIAAALVYAITKNRFWVGLLSGLGFSVGVLCLVILTSWCIGEVTGCTADAHAATREPVRWAKTFPGPDSVWAFGPERIVKHGGSYFFVLNATDPDSMWYRIMDGGYNWHLAHLSEYPGRPFIYPTRKVVMPSVDTRRQGMGRRTTPSPTANAASVAPGSSQSVAAAPVVKLSFTLPATQQGQPCADGAPLAWLDSVRVMARRRGPTGPYNSAAWVAYLALPDSLVAQHAVSWTRMGLADSFVVAALDTGATAWVQVRGTRGWSGICQWVRGWK